MAINPNAGNFSNFNKIGGSKPIQSKTPASSGPKEAPSVQQDPSESVQLGAQPMANAKTDSVSANVGGQSNASAPAISSTPTKSSIPSQVGDFLIAGVNGNQATEKVSFPGLSLNGPSSLKLETLGGKVIASASPLQPKSAMRMPTTSISAINSFGNIAESGTLAYASGREVSL